MKLLSWNVNGVRAVHRSGKLLECLRNERPQVLCIQETKYQVGPQLFSEKGQITLSLDGVPPSLHQGKSLLSPEEALFRPLGYFSFWHSARKPGYSGVALYSQTEPLWIQKGMGIAEIDDEGRVIVAEYSDFFLVNAYFPNSQEGGARLEYKLFFCEKLFLFLEFLKTKKKKGVVLCGDINIAHRELDLVHPLRNLKSPGFLPQERAWMDFFLQQGYCDTFRFFHPEAVEYTWWSYRSRAREKNQGWRIDGFFVDQASQERLGAAACLSQLLGSDHCPVLCEWKDDT